MQATIEKLGKELAVRIPRAFARDTRLRDGSAVDLRRDGARLVIQPAGRRRAKLARLLKLVTASRRHTEMAWGAPRGNEVW